MRDHITYSVSTGSAKVTGYNLNLVWAEFSTISNAVLMMCMYLSMWLHAYIFYS
jgi:hypothetical protein